MKNNIPVESTETLFKNMSAFEKNAADTNSSTGIPTPIMGADGIELGTSKRAGRYHDDYFRRYDPVGNTLLSISIGMNAIAIVLFSMTLLIDILK